MRTFLYEVARDLYDKCGKQENGLAHVTVVFPNKRARLFFDECLAEYCGKPVWSPSYTTIEELFHSHSDLQLADHIELVTILYDVYLYATQSSESLDSFWYWGEQMLSDFNDIDRNLADSEQLFSLLQEQKELTDTSFLNKKQLDALNQFFHGFDKKSSETDIMQKYKRIWSTLGTIYSKFNTRLCDKQMGYDGMIQRRVIKHLNIDTFTSHRYAFVGFNSLDKAERELFRALKKSGKAMFYWDYDARHIHDNSIHEAGLFMRDNIAEFPNELPQELFNDLKRPELTIVETGTDNAQARYITQWLDKVSPNEKAGKDIAIVLADESLLHPVLHSIPPHKTECVNITMGYRLADTPLYSFVMSLIEMQQQAEHFNGSINLTSFKRILAHPITSLLSNQALGLLDTLSKTHRMFPNLKEHNIDGKLSSLFRVCSDNISLLEYLRTTLEALVPACTEQQDNTLFYPLMQESLYRIYTHVNRLYSMVESGHLTIQTQTLCRLLRASLSSATVPFHGEPAVGMQIMGLIETRNLDFKHLLLLSAQEGCLPKSTQNASFIPYNIRVVFGLTTMEDKSAVASYNFYHLLERAESVTMVYNGNADASGIGKGQISRYLLQLSVDNPNIHRISLSTEQSETSSQTLKVYKTPAVMEQLCKKYNAENSKSYLSPTALNNYIDCPLKFYLQQVNGLRKQEDSDTEIDSHTFGTIFHRSAELAYNYLASLSPIDKSITADSIEQLLKDSKRLTGFVEQAFREELFNNKSINKQEYSGIQMVNFDVIYKYLRQVLKLDKECYAPFLYIGSESQEFKHYMEIDDPLHSGAVMRVRLQGIIDRMDSKEGIIRIVDYKTGYKKETPKSVSDMFDQTKEHNSQAFQIMYYAYIVCHNESYSDKKIAPVLLYTRSTSTPTKEELYYNIGSTPIQDFKSEVQKEFEPLLKKLIADIFDPQKPFEPTQNSKNCDKCDFKSLCARQ